MDLEKLLGRVLDEHASELRLVSGKKPAIVAADDTRSDADDTPWSADDILGFLAPVLNDERKATLEKESTLVLHVKVQDHKFRLLIRKVEGKVAVAAKPQAIATHLTVDESTTGHDPRRQSVKLGALKRNLIKTGKGRGTLEELFVTMEEHGASDLHLRNGRRPCYRIAGTILELEELDPFDEERIKSVVYEALTPEQIAEFERERDFDFAYRTPEGARFRVNLFIESSSIGLVARRISTKIPSLGALNLPEQMQQIPELLQGLVLVCGITGSGKSSTLAATIEAINQKRRCNIVTLEDPVEYAYKSKLALIAQREIGIDCASWDEGLRRVLRQDPDVILIGEMRDGETIETALRAAETGHLVFGTLHSSTVAQTLGRILEMFPPMQHQNIRQSLAFNLRAIICQKLLPARAGGMVPAIEFMLNSPSVSKMIREGRDQVINDIILGDDEMLAFNQSLHDMIKAGAISPRVGYEHSPKPEKLKMLLSGIKLSEDRRILG